MCDLWMLCEGFVIDVLFYFVNFDVSLLIGEFGMFVECCEVVLWMCWLVFMCLFFGYVGDGNVYIGVLLVVMIDVDVDVFDYCVYVVVCDMGGLVLVEYGIGVFKCFYFVYMCSDVEIGLM